MISYLRDRRFVLQKNRLKKKRKQLTAMLHTLGTYHVGPTIFLKACGSDGMKAWIQVLDNALGSGTCAGLRL
jgi:hypothetical protein